MWKWFPCQEGALGNPTCLWWKIGTVQKTGKSNLSKKDGNCQKQGKASGFQGRKVQEKLPDIKQENLVKESAISTLD